MATERSAGFSDFVALEKIVTKSVVNVLSFLEEPFHDKMLDGGWMMLRVNEDLNLKVARFKFWRLNSGSTT